MLGSLPSKNEIKRARFFLSEKGMAISPAMFAVAAKRNNMSFERLLNQVKRLLAAGSGVGPAPIATEIALRRR